MKLRTFLMLLAASGLVFVLSLLYTPNREVLNQRIFLSRDVSLPVWAMFLLVALTAMADPVVFGLIRDVKQLMDSVTRRRAIKAQKEIEQRYLLGTNKSAYKRLSYHVLSHSDASDGSLVVMSTITEFGLAAERTPCSPKITSRTSRG